MIFTLHAEGGTTVDVELVTRDDEGEYVEAGSNPTVVGILQKSQERSEK
jgi:hypothetical protein